jgi:hypothetical protein
MFRCFKWIFPIKCNHKILEFLVRGYEIHRFNVDQVMACILAYQIELTTQHIEMLYQVHVHQIHCCVLIVVLINIVRL